MVNAMNRSKNRTSTIMMKPAIILTKKPFNSFLRKNSSDLKDKGSQEGGSQTNRTKRSISLS